LPVKIKIKRKRKNLRKIAHEKILGNAGFLGEAGTDSITVFPPILFSDKADVCIED